MQFMQLKSAQAAPKEFFDFEILKESSLCYQIKNNNKSSIEICSVLNLHTFNLHEIRAKHKNLIPS